MKYAFRLFAAGFLVLFAIVAQCGVASASSCDVREYNQLGFANTPTLPQIAQEPAVAHNYVSISAAHAESPAFNSKTTYVWIQCPNVQACYEEGSPPANANATTSSPIPTGSGGVFFGVKAGAQVSMIACTP